MTHFYSKSKYCLDQCFYWGMNFHNLLRKKEGTEHFFLFGKNGAQVTHIMREKKSLKLPYLESTFQQVT